MNASKEMDIRYSDLSDEKYLLKWMQDPQVNQWFDMGTEEEIESGVKNWIGFSRFQSSLTATIDQIPTGIATLFLFPFRKMIHQAMIRLVVDPDYANKGVGTALVKNVLNLAEKYFRLESVFIEVFEGSKLLPILEKASFEKIFVQENFIKDEKGYRARILLEKRFV